MFATWASGFVSLVAGFNLAIPSPNTSNPHRHEPTKQMPRMRVIAEPANTSKTVKAAPRTIAVTTTADAPRARSVVTTFAAPRTIAVAKTVAASKIVTVPQHLFMPQNPAQPPGKSLAAAKNLPVLLAQRTTNYYHAIPSQGKNIELLAKRLNGVVVQPGETFSYYQHIGPYTATNGYGWGRAFDGDRIVPSMGGGVCQGASTLYSALLRTDLQVIERHNHGLTVPYLPAGEDATVAASAHMDFRFRNNEKTPIMIAAETNPSKRFLTVAIWGAHSGPQIAVRHNVLAEYPYKTVHRDGQPGQTQKVLFPGQEGAVVETWVDVNSANGVTHRLVSKDRYLASSRVITGK